MGDDQTTVTEYPDRLLEHRDNNNHNNNKTEEQEISEQLI